MAEIKKDLGKLIAVHGLSPAHIQRAVFITVLSFLFFMGTMVLYYVRQEMLYFLLSSAFLVVYIITLFSWIAQRKTVLEIFEKGIAYRKSSAKWEEIGEIRADGTIVLKNDKQIAVSSAIYELDRAISFIKSRIV
ncbi:MAG: hypothetical protein WBC19_00740 [Pyrinomonadaceae bacterium]